MRSLITSQSRTLPVRTRTLPGVGPAWHVSLHVRGLSDSTTERKKHLPPAAAASPVVARLMPLKGLMSRAAAATAAAAPPAAAPPAAQPDAGAAAAAKAPAKGISGPSTTLNHDWWASGERRIVRVTQADLELSKHVAEKSSRAHRTHEVSMRTRTVYGPMVWMSASPYVRIRPCTCACGRRQSKLLDIRDLVSSTIASPAFRSFLLEGEK